MTFAGAGASTTTISDAGPVFSIASGVDTVISGLTITGGTAASGGGIDNAGMLTLTADTISGNMATGSGGGIENEATGTLIISDSTISGNTAGGSGGGIDNAGMLTLTNTTISGNSAASGGGISDEGTLTAINVTIGDGNTSVGTGSGGGLDVTGAGMATLYNTIVAQNTDSGGADDIAGTGITSASSNNLVGADDSGTVASSNLLGGGNPYLGALADNGGPTETIALEPGSPAIDAGSNDWADTYGVTTDQRGALRGGQPDALNAGQFVDIGAYEASSSYMVTATADSDAIGTLLSAILWANTSSNANPANLASPTPAPNTIDFDIPASDPGYTEIAPGLFDAGFTYWTIAPTQALPDLGPDVTINGLSQPGVGPPTDPYYIPEIVLSGADAGPDSDGLDLRGGYDSVLDLTINGFSVDGIDVESSDNTMQYGGVGFDATGTVAIGNGVGILVTGADNLIGSNGQGSASLDLAEGESIAGNMGPGIWISGTGATNNVIAADYIGLGFIASPLPNGGDGVLIDNGANANWIGVNPVDGSETALQDNVISGNTSDGVEISGMDTTGNVVAGDYIGTDTSGTQPLPNYAGVEIDSGASGNLIGSNGDGVNDLLERNIISANLFTGVWITGTGTEQNVVAGNYIGTNVTGDTALGNGSAYVGFGDDDLNGGVLIDGGASDNVIGTSGQSTNDAGERNVISGNVFSGIILSSTSGNVVAGNYLATTASSKARWEMEPTVTVSISSMDPVAIGSE